MSIEHEGMVFAIVQKSYETGSIRIPMFTYTPTSNIMIIILETGPPLPPLKNKNKKNPQAPNPPKKMVIFVLLKSQISLRVLLCRRKNKMLVQYTKCKTPQGGHQTFYDAFSRHNWLSIIKICRII